MCSVRLPPSLPGPNWGRLTSWPQLNWVVVPVASVSLPVSQGGLHSHCVQQCIVQAGCNQADESCIPKHTLGASSFLHVGGMPWDTCAHTMQMQKYHCSESAYAAERLPSFYHSRMLKRWFTQVCRLPGRACAYPSCSRFSFCRLRETNPAPNHPSFLRDRRSDGKDVAPRPFYLFHYSIARVAGVLISGL